MQNEVSVRAGLRGIVLAALVLAAGPLLAQNWAPLRTPWGDPDLQGNYTNKYEQGTPFERPAEFEGRALEDIQGAELAELVRDRAEQVLLNSPFSGGDPQAGNLGGAPVFYDRFEASRGARPWFVVDPPSGQIPPMSAEGERASRERLARAPRRFGTESADSYENGSLYDRCITRGLPGSMMPTNYGNSYRIVQAPGYVAISYEMVHETRIIPLDTTPRVGDSIRQYMGDARGHWEGDTLVVETTNLRDAYRGANPERARYIERFTPVAADTLEWSFTVDDPTTWTRPWTFAMPLTRNDGEAILEYACHEGNRAMNNLLTGARADESALVDAPATAFAPDADLEVLREEASHSTARLSGAWMLESAEGGRGGRQAFAGFSVADHLVVNVSETDVAVHTDTGTQNQIRTAVYELDGSESLVPGPLGWRTSARASLEGDRLVVSVTRSIQEPDGSPVVFEIEDVYSVSGDVLTLERSQGGRTQTMVYTRF